MVPMKWSSCALCVTLAFFLLQEFLKKSSFSTAQRQLTFPLQHGTLLSSAGEGIFFFYMTLSVFIFVKLRGSAWEKTLDALSEGYFGRCLFLISP